MATPSLTKHRLQGILGEILVDVRAGGRGTPRPAVLVVHGFKGFKDWGMFPPLAERLAQAGFAAVALNTSGSGVDDGGDFVWPERFGHDTFSASLADLGTVLDALSAGELGIVPPSRIGLIGHSRGGGVAILQAARDRRVRALVTWAAISTVERWPDKAERDRWRATGKLDVINARTGQVLPLYTDVLDDVDRNATGALDIPAAAATLPIWSAHRARKRGLERRRRRSRTAGAGSPFRNVPVPADRRGRAHLRCGPSWTGSTPALDLVMKETVGWLSRHLL